MSTKEVTDRNSATSSRGFMSGQLAGLHREVDHFFEDFRGDFRPWRSGLALWDDQEGELVPKVDVSETAKDVARSFFHVVIADATAGHNNPATATWISERLSSLGDHAHKYLCENEPTSLY